MLFRAGDGLLEALAHKGERLASGHRRMALVDRLEICRRLQSCSREVVLAGDLLHEGLTVASQAIGRLVHQLPTLSRSRHQPATRPAMMSRRRSEATRS